MLYLLFYFSLISLLLQARLFFAQRNLIFLISYLLIEYP